ncbi:hypothetical protein AGRA3207_001277 [Actinomadura graeca]|uniref:Uncharacterized protein n=1 Tax=Actinomadura graeca TaxID=2750812 RepID=A0ABX8QT01_9ACTN|nr:hypothetical protein [Actinomadura graeca]QXJ20547.1 hypothetical protein AGRA3207_001277 [Actinomadura graeca]
MQWAPRGRGGAPHPVVSPPGVRRSSASMTRLAAALASAGIMMDVLRYAEHSTRPGRDSPAVAYAECAQGQDVTKTRRS